MRYNNNAMHSQMGIPIVFHRSYMNHNHMYMHTHNTCLNKYHTFEKRANVQIHHTVVFIFELRKLFLAFVPIPQHISFMLLFSTENALHQCLTTKWTGKCIRSTILLSHSILKIFNVVSAIYTRNTLTM